jgi:transaldolase
MSFKCTRDLADDTEATIAHATQLWPCFDLPNVRNKVPEPRLGRRRSRSSPRGININTTLRFSIERY